MLASNATYLAERAAVIAADQTILDQVGNFVDVSCMALAAGAVETCAYNTKGSL